MSSRLTRRAFFALPVALPVAAVAAKVAPAPAYRDAGRIMVGEARVMHAARPRFTAEDYRHFELAWRADNGVTTHVEWRSDPIADMTPSEWPDDAAKPVTAQAAAPVGDATSRSLEGDASDSAAPRQMAEPVVPAGNEGTSGERDTLAQPVAA